MFILSVLELFLQVLSKTFFGIFMLPDRSPSKLLRDLKPVAFLVNFNFQILHFVSSVFCFEIYLYNIYFLCIGIIVYIIITTWVIYFIYFAWYMFLSFDIYYFHPFRWLWSLFVSRNQQILQIGTQGNSKLKHRNLTTQ